MASDLTSAEPKVRFDAVRALGDLADPRATDLLAKALEDEDPSVRSEAAYVLGERGDEGVGEPLIAAIEDPDVQAAAAGALGKIGEYRAVRPLIGCLDDEQVLVQIAAARALGEIGDDRATIPLLKFARDHNRNTGARRVAAKALDRLGYAVESERSGPNPLLYWAIGLALMGGAVALAATAGSFAIVPFLAGLGFLVVYYLRETRAAKRGAYSLEGGGDHIYIDFDGDGGNGGGWGGNGGGG
jgi:HEAT repeat protein